MHTIERPLHTRADTAVTGFPTFICPVCRSQLQKINSTECICPTGEHYYEKQDGVWRLLRPERSDYFDRFIHEYRAIREAEGRWSRSADYYRQLPFKDVSGKFSRDWRIRSKSFVAFREKVLQPMRADKGHSLAILDLGAGNGWFSYRVQELGHVPVAVDLATDDLDGLAASKHYPQSFECVQAEFDTLPFSGEQFDLAVFNASWHYSENYETTLQEAFRVLKPDGQVVILDSPVYRDRGSGEQMAAERNAAFQEKFGIASDSIQSENYLTFQCLNDLAAALSLRWKKISLFYNIKWHLKPVWAKLRGHREPAKFMLFVGEKLH